jgi:hypothetical protein
MGAVGSEFRLGIEAARRRRGLFGRGGRHEARRLGRRDIAVLHVASSVFEAGQLRALGLGAPRGERGGRQRQARQKNEKVPFHRGGPPVQDFEPIPSGSSALCACCRRSGGRTMRL